MLARLLVLLAFALAAAWTALPARGAGDFSPRVWLPMIERGTGQMPAQQANGAAPPGAAPRIVDVGLDPGHSVADVGARGGDMVEHRLTLDLAQRVRARLEAVGLSVALTRHDHRPVSAYNHADPTERIRIEQEARIAVVVPARVYLSLHFNGFGDPAVRGTETYFNEDNHGAASRSLAHTVQREGLAALRAAGYPALDRGAKSDLAAGKPYGHFFSLRGPLPSALLEGAFLTNPLERAWLHEDAALDALAAGSARALIEVLAALR